MLTIRGFRDIITCVKKHIENLVKAYFTNNKKGVVFLKCSSSKEILSAKIPEDIFSMNPETLDEEKEEYLRKFKPSEYCTIENFMINKKVTILYNEAYELLNGDERENKNILELMDENSKRYCSKYYYSSNIKIGKMYSSAQSIIFVIDAKYEKYYNNYVSKVENLGIFDPNIWEYVKYMVPKISKKFKTSEGKFVVVVEKPHEQIYSLREILNYFGGRLDPRYVASILTKLYYFICYLNLQGLNHNAITVDNLFFSPGSWIDEGSKEFKIEDLRIVGVFGGWFFSTWSNEKVSGMPKSIKENIPNSLLSRGFSSYKIDELSIKLVAKELLGNDFSDVPRTFYEWIFTENVEINPYEELQAWKKARDLSFGKPKFTEMRINNFYD